jgi:hypothetical protein
MNEKMGVEYLSFSTGFRATGFRENKFGTFRGLRITFAMILNLAAKQRNV